MAAPASTLPAQQGAAAAGAVAQNTQPRPFAQSSHHGCEMGPSFTVQPGATAQTFGPFPLPATGYLRRVVLEVSTTTAGSGGTGSGDYPANIFQMIRLTDTNGAPIYELSGYNTLIADTYGGYAGASDWRVDPDYSASATQPAISPYIPLELDPSGLGSPANLSASSAYRLSVVVDTAANIWSTAPTTIPTLGVQVWCEYWTLPNPVDQNGDPQTVAPPFPGTVQLWSQQNNISVASGAARVQLNRTGNLFRTIGVVFRSSGTRSDSVVADPITLRWDDINLLVRSRREFRKVMREYANDLVSRDTGVYIFGNYNYGLSRFNGGSSVVSWLPTVSATRYELNFSSGGGGGTLDWVINDVSVAAQSAQQRATVGGAGVQFHPPMAGVPGGAS